MDIYNVSFGQKRGFAVQYYTYALNQTDAQEVLRILLGDKEKYIDVSINKLVPPEKYPKAKDGHWHKIDGKFDIHTWAECPDNPSLA